MQNQNLISQKIAAFYEETIESDFQTDVTCFFNEDNALKFKEIYTFMLPDLIVGNRNGVINFQSLEYEDFLTVYNKIKPIFKHSQIVIETVDIEKLCLNWLGSKEYMLTALRKAPDPDYQYGTEIIEQLLLITSIFEFALGSIFYTLSDFKTPPHLLKDLLCTKDLEICFGLEALTFLKIIIGSPKSINLRNIVWHGFPRPGTIPSYYVSTLIVIIHSLGLMLQEKEFKLIFRKQIGDFSTSLKTMCTACNIRSNLIVNECKYRSTVNSCWLIPQNYEAYWQKLYMYLQTKEYWRFVILILPQIELILRILYAKENNVDVSAKLDEYYITLDTIFEPTVPNATNQANGFFSETCDTSIGALHFIHDVFLAPKGPRLRDKISHGEVLIEAVNNQHLCELLLYLAFHLLTKSEEDYPLAKYESQFHANSYAKLALNRASEAGKEFIKLFEVEIKMDLTLNFPENRVKIFQRPQKEPIFMHLITKIANFLKNTCHNFEESIKLRQSLLDLHELHSKRRRTLENLVKSLPTFCCCLNLMLKCLSEIYICLQTCGSDIQTDFATTLEKFLKRTLSIAENFVKYSHKDSNEWIKITELSKTFEDFHTKLYLRLKKIV